MDKKLAGLKLDLLEARKAVETFDVDDIRNMFEQAGYVVEFDNNEWCIVNYEAGNVEELIAVGIDLTDYLVMDNDKLYHIIEDWGY